MEGIVQVLVDDATANAIVEEIVVVEQLKVCWRQVSKANTVLCVSALAVSVLKIKGDKVSNK